MKFLVDSLPYYGEPCPFQDVCDTNNFNYEKCPRHWDKYFICDECEEKNPRECEYLKEVEEKYEEIEKLQKDSEDDISKDPIFLLSIEEYERYQDKIPSLNCGWWLRSSGASSDCTALVTGNGSTSSLGIGVQYDGEAVRPVLKISNLKSFEAIKVDEMSIFFCGITWVKIDEDLYIAEIPITFRRFDENSNDYTTSEIREFLLDWYENRRNW